MGTLVPVREDGEPDASTSEFGHTLAVKVVNTRIRVAGPKEGGTAHTTLVSLLPARVFYGMFSNLLVYVMGAPFIAWMTVETFVN